MKKLFSILLAASMAATLAVGASAAEQTLKSVNGTPTIDAVKDAMYDGSTPVVIERNGSGDGEEKNGEMATGTVWSAWDADNIYFFIEINDSTKTSYGKTHEGADVAAYMTDSVELCLDFVYDGTSRSIYSAEPEGVGQFTFASDLFKGSLVEGSHLAGGTGAVTDTYTGKYFTQVYEGVQTAFKGTASTYVWEVAIPYDPDLAPVALGDVFGLVAQYNDDSNDNAKRDWQITSSDEGAEKPHSSYGYEWQNELELIGEYVPPVVDNDSDAGSSDAGSDSDPTTSTDTFDPTVIGAVSAVLAAAGYAVAKKKR